eukprot:sb/3468876/
MKSLAFSPAVTIFKLCGKLRTLNFLPTYKSVGPGMLGVKGFPVIDWLSIGPGLTILGIAVTNFTAILIAVVVSLVRLVTCRGGGTHNKLTIWGCWAYQGDLKYAILALNSNSYFCYSPSKLVVQPGTDRMREYWSLIGSEPVTFSLESWRDERERERDRKMKRGSERVRERVRERHCQPDHSPRECQRDMTDRGDMSISYHFISSEYVKFIYLGTDRSEVVIIRSRDWKSANLNQGPVFPDSVGS